MAVVAGDDVCVLFVLARFVRACLGVGGLDLVAYEDCCGFGCGWGPTASLSLLDVGVA